MTPISIQLSSTKEPAEYRKEFVCDENSFEPITYLDMDPFDVYQRDMSSGWMALGGICISTLFSITIICCGISLAYYRHTIDEVALPPSWRNGPFGAATAVFVGVIAILPTATPSNTEVLSLALTLIVTICTESIGFVHSMTLKSALIHESRLHCNTNLRLFTAARGTHWTNPNGTLLNAIMATLLIVSYVSSSLVFIPFHARAVDHSLDSEAWWNTCIFAPPVLTLGTTLLLQAIIAMAGLSRARVLTWSSSPINTTAALLHDGQLARIPGRCMHHVLHSTSYLGPRPPLERQPSAWQAHPSIKKIVITLWCLVLACLIWGGMVIVAWAKWFRTPLGSGMGSWSIFPNVRTNLIGYEFYVDPDRGCPVAVWIGIFIIFIILQGGVTMGLHCSEVIANVARDELIWRRATSNEGIKPSKNPLMTVLESWPNVGLLIAKPVLHWTFGRSFDVEGITDPTGDSLIQLVVIMRSVKIFHLALGLSIFAAVSTILTRRHPRGPQPAAYGHLQTLANLVDEWSPTMWWGHKNAGKPIYHAGTSNWPLPPVRMNSWYAGT